MFKSIISFPIRSIIHFLVMVPWLSFGILIGLFDRESGVSIIFSWIRFFSSMYSIEVSVRNDNDSSECLSGCVFSLLNQNSLLDGPVGICAIPRPCKGIVNLEYAMIPFFGWSMWIFCWVIIRQWPSQARKTLAKVESYLQNGGNLWMSIEGRRSKNGSLSQFKKGPVVMAIRAQTGIVPVIIYGTKEVLGYGNYRIKPGKVVVRLLKKIHTNGMKYEDRVILLNQLVALAESEVPKN
jgi:1-acyl-sn-glycerol-3-phosphate acyltransferase